MRIRALVWLVPLCILLVAAVSRAAPIDPGPGDDIAVKLAHGSERERNTEAQLRRLLHQYDVRQWTFTRSLVIDQDDTPHSHPVLTLHTRHSKDDELLLSTFIHEQMHWLIAARQSNADAAMRELRGKYPKIPVGYPQGSNDEAGNYEHLIVVYLEYRADQTLLGELKAREVMQFWANDHYTWIYTQVLHDPEAVGKVVKAHGLVP